jgi:NADH-quinone oxidoreductase subunit C
VSVPPVVNNQPETVEEPPAPPHSVRAALIGRGDGVLLAWDEARGEASATIAPAALRDTLRWLREAHGFGRLSGLLGIDTLTYPVPLPGQPERGTPRFGVVYHLAGLPPSATRLRVRVFVADGAAVPSVVDLWPGANFFEREIYDLFGIAFAGHPDMRRIMMPEEWVGHPLRKDSPLGGERVEFSHTVDAITARRPKAEG